MCSCECKIAARKGICLPECRQYYPDSECCARESTPSTTTVTTTTTRKTTTITTQTTTTTTTTTSTSITSSPTTETTTKKLYEDPTTSGDNQKSSSIVFTPGTEKTIIPSDPTTPYSTTLSSVCPSQCQLPQGLPWSMCPSECGAWSSLWSGEVLEWTLQGGSFQSVMCCTPECPAKCSRNHPKGECSAREGVRECDYVPGCCPDKYEQLYGDVYFGRKLDNY